jgi:hypothetical protein
MAVKIKDAVFWDMAMPFGSCKSRVSEEYIAFIFRMKESESSWFSERMNLKRTGQRASWNGVSNVVSICYRGDIVEYLPLPSRSTSSLRT